MDSTNFGCAHEIYLPIILLYQESLQEFQQISNAVTKIC